MLIKELGLDDIESALMLMGITLVSLLSITFGF
jgi:hypothetical protein